MRSVQLAPLPHGLPCAHVVGSQHPDTPEALQGESAHSVRGSNSFGDHPVVQLAAGKAPPERPSQLVAQLRRSRTHESDVPLAPLSVRANPTRQTARLLLGPKHVTDAAFATGVHTLHASDVPMALLSFL